MGISASVGRGGVNHPADVTYVQQLLNRIALNRGGPNPPFMLFGTPGDKLSQAILRFQQANCPGIADGRIDAGGRTLSQLTSMANALGGAVDDPGAGPVPKFVPGVLDDIKPKFSLDKILSALKSVFPHPTPWSFNSSAGLSVGAPFTAGAWGWLYLKRSNPDETPSLSFAAAGIGVSVAPVSAAYSTPSMYSRGIGSIWTSSPVNLKAADMAGSLLILNVSTAPIVAGYPAIGVSIYLLNLPNPGMALVKILEGPSSLYEWFHAGGTTARALGVMVGVAKSTPDIGSISLVGGWSHLRTGWIL
jgi:hypothetical protein